MTFDEWWLSEEREPNSFARKVSKVAWDAAVDAERARCAKIAEQVIDPVDSPLTELSSNAARLIAELIRDA